MKKYFTFVILFCSVILFSCTSDDQYWPMHGPQGGWPMMHYGYGGWFMWLILVIVIAFVLYFFVQTQRGGSHRETPLEVLKKRYAKGEITKEEYDRMRRDLAE